MLPEETLKEKILKSITIDLSEIANLFNVGIPEAERIVRKALEKHPDVNFILIPKSKIFIELSRLGSIINRRGKITLEEIAKECNVTIQLARNFLNTLIVTGFPGIYINDNTFVTFNYLQDEIRDAILRGETITIEYIASKFNVDERVAYNIYMELKRRSRVER